MATIITTSTPTAWGPDVVAYPAADVVPDALILQTSTVVGSIEGDDPAVRVPWVDPDDTVGFVDEGAPIPENASTYSETVVRTGKVATLGKFSREQLAQPNAATLVVNALSRSVINKANVAYLGNAADPTGLLNLPGITDGGTLGTDLDSLNDAVLGIETEGGQASHIIAHPSAWGAVSKLKGATGSAVPLLGAGTDQTERRVLGVPVLVTNAAPVDTLLVVDSTAIVSAVGQLQLARSEEAYFGSDVVGVRVTFRLGWAAMKPERIVKVSTATE